jgi:hypothetical protein
VLIHVVAELLHGQAHLHCVHCIENTVS